MLIALLLAAGLAWWMHRRGELLPNLGRLAIGGGALFAAIRMLESGKPLIAAGVAAAGALWWHSAGRRANPRPDLALARATLGVDATADAAAIRAAHRRLIAEVHPDRGGSSEHAARVTAARDLLLERLAR